MTKAKNKFIPKDKIICLSLCGLIVSLVFLYIYFLSASIVHVVIRKEANQDLVALHSAISQLETEYIDAQHQVSDEIASLEGYAPVTHKVFIDRTPGSLVLSDGGQ